MRIVDLFCGIGGVDEAIGGPGCRVPAAEIVAAMDIDRSAAAVYAANHGVIPQCVTLESIRRIPTADLWWLSPPCQPYTTRGRSLGDRNRFWG